MSRAPSADAVTDRALLLYAYARRASIEHALEGFGHDPARVAQAERARTEALRWLEREGVTPAATDDERALLEAPSGSWPSAAVLDGTWRKEALGVLLWSLRHVDALPGIDEEFEVAVLNERIERYGSVSSFRANGSPRDRDEVEARWREADTWFAATEGRDGPDAALASISAERSRALAWLLDGARPLP